MASQEERKLQALQKSRQLMLDNLSLLKQTQDAHKAEYEAAVAFVNQMEDYYKLMSDGEKAAFDARKKMIKDYQQSLKSIESLNKGLEQNSKQTKNATKEVEKQRKAIQELRKETKNMVNDQSEIVKGLTKMNQAFKGNSKTQKEINTGFASLEVSLKNVNQAIGDGKKLHKDELKEIQKFKAAYNEYATSVVDVQREVAEKNLSEEQAIEIIKKQREAFNDVTKELKFTTKEGAKVRQEIQGMTGYADEFGKKLEGLNKKAADLKSGFDEMKGQLGSMVPMGKELLDVFSKFGKIGFAGALAALGASAGKFLNESGLLKKALPGIKDRLDVEQEGKRATFDKVTQPLARKEFEIDQRYAKDEFKIDQKYEAQRHAITMGNKQAEAAMTFKSEASMAYFGKALPNLAYAANQLQNAGISADTIANASVSIASNMGVGGRESAKLGTDMAVFAKFAGIGAEEAGGIAESFKLMDGVTAATATNMMQGVKAMAEQLDLNPGAVMKEMASASEIALEMNINSGKALAKQVTYATSLGVSFSKIAKAGQSMVLNYKDSIKSEMQLSALLGKQVDLSEVRAKFAEGDTTGAMQALQAQGLDPAQMDMFQKQALQQATGMDIADLTKIGKGGGKEAGVLDAAATKIDNASIHAANKHLLAAETARQVSLDNQRFGLEQAAARKQFELDQAKAREDFELSQAKARESFEADLSFDRTRQEIELQQQLANLGNTILTELIPALLAFGAGGGISAVTDLVGMFKGRKKGGGGRNRTRQSSAQRRTVSTPSPAAGGPAAVAPGAPQTNAQKVAAMKAANPGMTSQQALAQVKAGGAPPAGGAPKPAAPTAAPKPAMPPAAAPKIPAAAPIQAPKMSVWDKLNPKKFLGKAVSGAGGIGKVFGAVAGKVAGPLGSLVSGFTMYKDLAALVTMNDGPLPDLYKSVGGSLMGLVGSILGGAVGSAFLGPIGAMLGSTLGSTAFSWLADLFPGVPTFLGEFLVDKLGLFGKPGSALSGGTAGGTTASNAINSVGSTVGKASAIVGTSMAIGKAAAPTAAGGGGGVKSVAAAPVPAAGGGGAKATTPGATGSSTKTTAAAGGMLGMMTGVALQKIFSGVNSKTEGFIDQAKTDSTKQTQAILDQTKVITAAKGLPVTDNVMQQQLNDLLKIMTVVYGEGGTGNVTLLLDGQKVTKQLGKRAENSDLVGGNLGSGVGGGKIQ